MSISYVSAVGILQCSILQILVIKLVETVQIKPTLNTDIIVLCSRY